MVVEKYLNERFLLIYEATHNDRLMTEGVINAGGFYNMPSSEFKLEITLNQTNFMRDDSCFEFHADQKLVAVLVLIEEEIAQQLINSYFDEKYQYYYSDLKNSKYERDCDFEIEQYNKILTMLKEKWNNGELKASKMSIVERMLNQKESR